MNSSDTDVPVTTHEENNDDPKGVFFAEGKNIAESTDGWLSYEIVPTEESPANSPIPSSNQINNISATSDSNPILTANSSSNDQNIQHSEPVDMKKVLAERLRRRIEDREAGTPTEPQNTNGTRKEDKLELQSQEELNDLDYIEGFQIFADDTPTDISKLPPGQYHQMDLSPSSQRPIRRKTPSVKIADNYFTFNPMAPTISPPKPKETPVIHNPAPSGPVPPVHTVSKTAHTSYFGPHVIKRALRSMNNRATAVAITDWIVDNLPQYLHYFGDKKKLRYSVVGILSAKAYANIFQKEIVVERGVRKSDWILMDPNDIDDESNFLPMAAVANFLPPVDNNSNITDISANASMASYDGEHLVEKTALSTVPMPDPYERKDCVICGQGTDDNKLLLCDACDSGYHIYCLQPPLKAIPRGAWYCTSCIGRGQAPTLTSDQLSEDESAFDHPAEDDLDRDTEEEPESLPGACEKHRKWKKRCPPDCAMRRKLRSDKFDYDNAMMAIPRYKKKGHSKRKNRDSEGYRKSKKVRGSGSNEAPTYIDMIEEAIKALGGQATTPDITNFMESHYDNLLATKTKTWRNSVSGCLSTHFARIKSKEGDGRAIWTLAFPTNEDQESDLDIHAEEDDFFDDMEIVELQSEPSPSIPSYKTRATLIAAPKYKAPKRRAHVVFEPYRLEELKAENPDDYETLNATPISYINKTHPLDVIKNNLAHAGGVMRLVWSTDLTKLASVSTLGSIKIWNVEDWTLIKELKDKEETNIDEFFALEWSPDDTKLILAGKLKDRKKWDPEEEDHASLPSAIKIFDFNSGKVTLKLEGHTSDVLDIKLVSFCHQTYLISAGSDGTVRKWHLSDDLNSLLETSDFRDYGSKLAVCIQFVPGTGKKFFFVACDSGLKLFDFETEQLVQDFPGIYTYLCDSIKFTKWLDSPIKAEDQPSQHQYPPLYILSKGVELLDQEDKVVRPNSCHLHRFELPEGGKGKFKLELVNEYTHEWYHSNIWQMRLNSNGRYALCPTTEGKIFVWNLKSKEVVAILHEHGNREVRDIVFHPKLRLMVTCADDSMIRVYSQKEVADEPSPSMPAMIPQAELLDPEVHPEPVPVRISTNEDEHVDIDSDHPPSKEADISPALRKSSRVRQPSSLITEDMEVSEFYKTIGKTSPSNSPSFGGSAASSPGSGSGSEKKRSRGLPGACEQHKRDHVKCPPDCPRRVQ